MCAVSQPCDSVGSVYAAVLWCIRVTCRGVVASCFPVAMCALSTGSSGGPISRTSSIITDVPWGRSQFLIFGESTSEGEAISEGGVGGVCD